MEMFYFFSFKLEWLIFVVDLTLMCENCILMRFFSLHGQTKSVTCLRYDIPPESLFRGKSVRDTRALVKVPFQQWCGETKMAGNGTQNHYAFRVQSEVRDIADWSTGGLFCDDEHIVYVHWILTFRQCSGKQCKLKEKKLPCTRNELLLRWCESKLQTVEAAACSYTICPWLWPIVNRSTCFSRNTNTWGLPRYN